MIKSKKHRLDCEFYELQITSFTICLLGKGNAASEEVFKPLNEILLKVMNEDNCLLHIWLLMPDHCHLIVEPGEKYCSILETIDKFKQHSGYWFYKNYPCIKWQKSYYDHILRNEKGLENQFYYILNNPVRKGIVEHWKQYPYKFSMVYNLNKLT